MGKTRTYSIIRRCNLFFKFWNWSNNRRWSYSVFFTRAVIRLELIRKVSKNWYQSMFTIKNLTDKLQVWNFWQCFSKFVFDLEQARTTSAYQYVSPRLSFIWFLGVVFRWFFLLPWRLAVTFVGMFWMVMSMTFGKFFFINFKVFV